MKTDSIFYRLFQEFPQIFFELIDRSPDEAIHYQFTSREVKQLAFRMDGLFLPTIDERDRPFYLVEVQFQPDETFYYRLFMGVVKLIIEDERTIVERVTSLVERAKQQLKEPAIQRNLIDLIETIIVYKLPQKSWEEIEAMFGLSELKQTRVYREALEEGKLKGQLEGERKAKLEAIPELLKEGLSIEQIARALKLPVEVVQQEIDRGKK